MAKTKHNNNNNDTNMNIINNNTLYLCLKKVPLAQHTLKPPPSHGA